MQFTKFMFKCIHFSFLILTSFITRFVHPVGYNGVKGVDFWCLSQLRVLLYESIYVNLKNTLTLVFSVIYSKMSPPSLCVLQNLLNYKKIFFKVLFDIKSGNIKASCYLGYSIQAQGRNQTD